MGDADTPDPRRADRLLCLPVDPAGGPSAALAAHYPAARRSAVAAARGASAWFLGAIGLQGFNPDSGSFLTFLTALCGLIAALTAAGGMFLSVRRSASAERQAILAAKESAAASVSAKENSARIQEIHISIDGRMDELLRVTREAAMARGGVIERDRSDAQAVAVAKATAEPPG